MTIDFPHFTPGASLAGGAVIGVAAALLLLFLGRIAGISGILGGLLGLQGRDSSWRGDIGWRVAFVAGLLAAPMLLAAFGNPIAPTIEAGWPRVIAAGLLVGIGTRYASGCTSGHGVCGLSRGSVRSLAATLTFMAGGFATVFVTRHLLGG